jgi:hypothetical protein
MFHFDTNVAPLRAWLMGLALCVALIHVTSAMAGALDEFEKGAHAMNARLASEMRGLQSRVKALQIPQVLGANELMSTDSRDEIRKNLSRLERLRAERNQMLERHFAELEAYVSNARLNPSDKQDALRGFRDGRDAFLDSMAALESAERDNIRATQDTLAFVDRNVSTIKVDRGKLVFEQRDHAKRFNALARQVKRSWSEVTRTRAALRRSK